MEIGKRIQRLRKDASVSQVQLAAHLGFSQPTLSNTENGIRAVTAAEVTRILEAIKFLSEEAAIVREEAEKAEERAIVRIRTRRETAPRGAVSQQD